MDWLRLLLVPVVVSHATGCSVESHAHAAADFAPGPSRRLPDGALELRPESLPYIKVQAVGEGQVRAFVRAPGRATFRDGGVSEVGTPVAGRVTKVHVEVGQRVVSGDALVTIESPSAAAIRGELARAQVLATAAEVEAKRQAALQASGVGVEAERVRAEAQLAEASATLAALRASSMSIGRGNAATVVVRAPIAGTVLVRPASVGAVVDPGGGALVVVGDPSSVRLVVQVFEREWPLVEPGARATVHVATAAEPLTATVEAVGAAVDPQSRRAPVYLSLSPSDARGIRAGMFVEANIEVGNAGLGIPSAAVLIKDGGKTVVYVERAERVYEAREIQIGATIDGRVPVLSGLSREDRVVTQGALLLDGQADLLR